MQTEQEGFLNRWSRRKQQTKEQAESEVTTDVELQLDSQNALQTEIQQSEILADEEVAEPVLTDADMPPLESLNEDSDYSGFMSTGVSDELRNLALKQLFKAATFNVRDGLDEYDEDYTSFEKLGDIVTCDMKHQMEVEARQKLEEEAELQTSEQVVDPSELEMDQTTELDDEIEAVEDDDTDAQLTAQSSNLEIDSQSPDGLVNSSSPLINKTDIETENL